MVVVVVVVEFVEATAVGYYFDTCHTLMDLCTPLQVHYGHGQVYKKEVFPSTDMLTPPKI